VRAERVTSKDCKYGWQAGKAACEQAAGIMVAEELAEGAGSWRAEDFAWMLAEGGGGACCGWPL